MRSLLLLGILYVNQGLPYGFFLQTLPVLMRQEGAGAKEIGALTFLALPWVLKILWAPFVDRIGSRRGWIIGLQAILPLVVAALAFVHDFRSIAVGVLVLNFLVATLDIAVDGLAVETLARKERGWGNALQAGGYKVGLIIGGGLLPGLFLGEEAATGWTQTLLALSVLMLPALLIAWFMPRTATSPKTVGSKPAGPSHSPLPRADIVHSAAAEFPPEVEPFAPEQAESGSNIRPTHRSLWTTLLAGSGAVSFLLFALFSKFGDSVGTAMFRVFLVDRGWAADRITLIIGTWGLAASITGSLIAAIPLRRWGHRGPFYVFGFLQAAFFLVLALALVLDVGDTTWGALLVAEHFVSGLVTTALFTLFMDRTPRHAAGSGFTALTILSTAGMGLGSLLGGGIVDASGFLPTFLTAGAAAFLPLVFLLRAGRRDSLDAN